MIVRGSGSSLYDESGVAYLDTRNNVCHVGHCHPKVVAAVSAQAAAVNTNSRYLHPNVCLLAQRITSTMPAGLDVVFFVNSGSEANDLALRLARAHTGGRANIVVDHAYHGHTAATIDVSPYKYAHVPGGDVPRPPHAAERRAVLQGDPAALALPRLRAGAHALLLQRMLLCS